MSHGTTPGFRPTIGRAPLGFFGWLLVGFLLTSGILHLHAGWGPVLEGVRMTREGLWEVAVGTFSVLLSGQVFLRTPAARYSISLLFLMQAVAFVQRYAWIAPERWLDESGAFRLQRLAELAFFSIAMVIVHFRPSRVRTA